MTGTDAVATGPRRVTSQILFRGHGELRILHAGQEYRLTVTRQGKLILTK
ncbi:MAG: hemin uptake protein HemP [Sulfuricaulis sp.]|nr:hemin uptake protein HemP [Sulfuricaulis sp.]